MTRKDLLLLVLGAARGEYLSPVQLQKSLYVLGRQCPNLVGNDYYKFVHYNYGAFSAEIYQDLESPTLGRLVKTSSRPGRKWFEYAITQEGLKYAQRLEVAPEIREHVSRLVDWARTLSFDNLVNAVYKAYPETRENSIFRGN
jgi:hypothetical protein